MKKTKKLIAVLSAVMMAVTLMSVGVAAKENADGTVSPDGVVINIRKKTLRVDDTFDIEADPVPYEADVDTELTWRSSNPIIADVDDYGTVTAYEPGETTITVRAKKGRSASCIVTVPGKVIQHDQDEDVSSSSSTATVKKPSSSKSSSKTSSSKASSKDSVELTEKLARATLLEQTRKSGTTILNNYSAVSAESIQAVAAEKSGAIVHFDTKQGKNVVGRVSIAAANAKGLTGDIKLGVYSGTGNTKDVQATFTKHYSNATQVVKCEQIDFGMDVKIAVKSKLSATGLKFYQYDDTTRKCKEIKVAGVTKDSGGYLHFTTSAGGYIIISQGELK